VVETGSESCSAAGFCISNVECLVPATTVLAYSEQSSLKTRIRKKEKIGGAC